MTGACRVLVGKPEEKRAMKRLGQRWDEKLYGRYRLGLSGSG